MQITNDKFKELLVAPGHISEEDFKKAEAEAVLKKVPLETLLTDRGLITDSELGLVIAGFLGCRFMDLRRARLTAEVIDIVPEVVAVAQEAVAFEIKDNVVKVATARPENYEFFKLLEKKTGCKVEVYYATPLAIKDAIRSYKSDLSGCVNEVLKNLATNPLDQENTVKLVDLFLEYAYENRASDIHIEPAEKDVSVRFRIDGVLHEIATYPIGLHDKLVFRLKILSRLRTDEHAAAQDEPFSAINLKTRRLTCAYQFCQ